MFDDRYCGAVSWDGGLLDSGERRKALMKSWQGGISESGKGVREWEGTEEGRGGSPARGSLRSSTRCKKKSTLDTLCSFCKGEKLYTISRREW